MIHIEKIIKSNKKGYYKIYFKNNDSFDVHEDTLLEYELLLKDAITEDELKIIKLSNNYSEAYYSAINFISHKIRSELEIKKYLQKKEVSDKNITNVVEKLKNQGYINDKYYAECYTNTIMRTTNKGKEYIKNNLLEHNINKEIIDECLSNLDEEDEFEKLYKLITKKIKLNKKYSNNSLKEKLYYEFRSKGYSTDIINLVFSEVVFSDDEEKLIVQLEKYRKKYSDKLKIKKLLLSKGFNNSLIDKHIN